MPSSTRAPPELTFLQTDFASTLIARAPTTVTNFTVSLKNFLNSRHATLNLGQYESNDEIVKAFNAACQRDLQTLLEDALYTPSLTLLDKSSVFSEHLRSRGNEYYKQRRLVEALRCYTLAAAFAPTGSKSSALAFSNRSACFFEQSDYTLSLDDILRFEHLYPSQTDNIALKLRERKQKCVEKLDTERLPCSENVEFCKTFFRVRSTNERIPSAESFIGIRNDDKRGRHVVNVGDQTIPPGQLIILEPPFSHILLKCYSLEFKHCNTCLKDLNGGGIPCDNCVFAMFCSPGCQQSKTSHTPTECQISRYLHEIKPDRTVQLALSILLNLPPSQLLPSSPLSLLTPSSTNTPSPSSPYPPGFTGDGIYSSKAYAPIENLIYHREILTNTDLFKYATYSFILTSLLSDKTRYFPPNDTVVQDRFQANLLLHQMNLPCNAHSLYKLRTPPIPTPDQIKTSEYEEVGAGAFALLSMINHSCDPNVVRITLPNALTAVISIHAIPPNAEILDNYGVHFATDPQATRKTHLTSHYNFTCDCPPCTENWPTIELLLQEDQSTRICVNCVTPYKATCQSCKHEPEDEVALNNHSNAETHLLQNNPTDSFTLSTVALAHFDATYKKPHKLVCISQEYLKQALFLVTRSMFR